MLKHVPNILTIFRFILIPATVTLAIKEQYIWTAIFYTISGITDILDGYIARKFNLISNFGKLMDPLADKLSQISILIVLTIKNVFPLYVLIVVLSKELIMILGSMFLLEKDVVVSSGWYGKLATTLFYIAVIAAFAELIFNLPFHIARHIMLVALISTIFALIMYAKLFFVKKKDV